MIRILAISGSLRKMSSNTTLLHAVATLAPQGVSITIYSGLGDLPHFNPDLEGREWPSVVNFRHQIQLSDGVFISSPEYAHGVPGVLKNALDWIVGSGELTAKPVALLNASSRSTYAQKSLRETLTVMSARLVRKACVTIPLLGKTVEPAGITADFEMSKLLLPAIIAFTEEIGKIATVPESPKVSANKYVDPTEQLVTEIIVRDIRKSVDFYLKLGFAMLRDAGKFVELMWEEHRFFMAEQSVFEGVDNVALADVPFFPVANVRVMGPKVDECWKLVNEIGTKIVVPIGDRSYGLRDFTIADPDGFGIRFASLL